MESHSCCQLHATPIPTEDAASGAFEITPSTREAIEAWIKRAGLKSESFLLPRRVHASPHFSTRQYAVVVQLEVNSVLEREKNFTLRSK
jgi:hypothetical protein